MSGLSDWISFIDGKLGPGILPPGDLVSSAELLACGGDDRIERHSVTLTNRYGCPTEPDNFLIALGSSTASVISSGAMTAVEALRERLLAAARGRVPQDVTYAHQMDLTRVELLGLLGLSHRSDLDLVFAASGTDGHLLAGQIAALAAGSKVSAVLVDESETGSGVPEALMGRHFSIRAAFSDHLMKGDTVGGAGIAVASVPCRDVDGAPISAMAIDAKVKALALEAIRSGRRVLLNVVDLSKSGMIVPSLTCAVELSERFPGSIDVLVDACQMRIAPETLAGYLDRGWMVAITGSKFLTGPPFSGALLLPSRFGERIARNAMPLGLGAYSSRGDWPVHLRSSTGFSSVANYGALMRWQAALHELRRFMAVPAARTKLFLQHYAAAVSNRLAVDAALGELAVPTLDRSAVAPPDTWDACRTIHPFLLRATEKAGHGGWIDAEATRRVFFLMGKDLSTHAAFAGDPAARRVAGQRYQIGQPVACGVREGVKVAALRLCASARVVADAVGQGGLGEEKAIAEAMGALDKAALLARHIDRL